jgi:hypothetical protein
MVAVFFIGYLVVMLFGTVPMYAWAPRRATAMRQAAFFAGQEGVRADERCAAGGSGTQQRRKLILFP